MNIGISGPTGAGKTTAAVHLASTYGLSYLRYSEILADFLGKMAPDKQTLRKMGWDVMSEGLQLSLNQRLLTKMKKGINYVVDGLRHPLDLETLSNHPPFYLLYIDASPHMRWQRLSYRDGSRTWEEFQAGDSHPIEGYLPILKQKAYKVVRNEGTIAGLYANLDGVFKEIQELGEQ